MRPTPDFERFRRAVLCQEPDRVPLAELQIDQEIRDAFMGRPVTTPEDLVEFWKTAGYDYVIVNPRNVVADAVLMTPALAKYSVYTTEKVERKWAIEHDGRISSRSDLSSLPPIEARSADYQIIRDMARRLPAGMGLIVQIGGFFEFAWQLMGFERFALSLVDDPELIDGLFGWVSSALLKHFEAIMDFEGISGVWLCDDIAYTEGLIVSPKILRKYVFPFHKKICQLSRKRGLVVLYHSDGDLSEVMGDLLDNGIHALHPIEPKAMDIEELKRRYAGRLALVGNIDLGYTLTRGTPDEVRAEVRKRIQALAPGGGYLVASSNTICNYVPLENFKAMIEAVFEFGRYPIGRS